MSTKLNYLSTILSIFFMLLTFTFVFAQGIDQEKPGNGNGNPNKVNKIIKLQATSVEPNANGIAKIMFKTKGNAMQKFQIVGANLKMSQSYEIFVDGLLVDTQVADIESGDNGAAIEVMFAKKAKGNIGSSQKPLPASLDPVTNIRRVEIRANNEVVLFGEFTNN